MRGQGKRLQQRAAAKGNILPRGVKIIGVPRIRHAARLAGVCQQEPELAVRIAAADAPHIAQVAVGRRDHLTIFGNDYPTPDGTCRRDYIHVMDLADGHVKAVEYAAQHKGVEVFNLGTGTPYSVLEIVHAFEDATGVAIKHEFGARRAGDLPEFWANADKAEKVLGWKAERDLTAMCRDTWRWQSGNPEGYTSGN